jgi:hypothetical protein
METTDGWRQRLRRGRRSGTRLRWAAAISAWLGLGLIVASGLINASTPGSRHLVAIREVSGTVTIVNYDASKFCLDSDGTGDQFCSVSYQRVGSTPLAVGEHVAGTVALLATAPSVFTEVFILAAPAADTVATTP